MAETPLMKEEYEQPVSTPPPYEQVMGIGRNIQQTDSKFIPTNMPYTINGPDTQYPFPNTSQVQVAGPPAPVPIIITQQPPNVNLRLNMGQECSGLQPVGAGSLKTICGSCNNHIQTKTKTSHKCKTHCCCLLLCLTGVFCPCFFLPYCCCAPEKVEHACPKCGARIGTYYG